MISARLFCSSKSSASFKHLVHLTFQLPGFRMIGVQFQHLIHQLPAWAKS
jgi:hypothetical protein